MLVTLKTEGSFMSFQMPSMPFSKVKVVIKAAHQALVDEEVKSGK